MMQIIKFRAWDDIEKQMHTNPYNGKIGGLNDIFASAGNWEYMQYIGINDETGKEIYVGDVVRVSSDPCFVGEVIDRFGAYGIEYNGHGIYFLDVSQEVHVIGNIHESPNLLRIENNA